MEEYIKVFELFLTKNRNPKTAEHSIADAEYRMLNGFLSSIGKPLNPENFPIDKFCGGKYYFTEKIPQRLGVRPVVVHCDIMDGMLAKRNILKRRTMWMISDRGEECPIPNTELIESIEDSNLITDVPIISLKLLTYNRPESLLRCLLSLRNADYMGDTVNIDIFIDFDGNSAGFPSIVLQIVDEFYWPHGEKRIHYRSKQVDITSQWMEAWYPSLDTNLNQYAFFIEDDIEVSPLFYRWLVAAVKNYYLNPKSDSRRLFGISLQKIQMLLPIYPRSFPTLDFPRNQSILYQLPSTWGVLYPAKKWKMFRHWYDLQNSKNMKLCQQYNMTLYDALNDAHMRESLAPFVPGNLISNEWYRLSSGRLFLSWLIKFTKDMGLIYMYPQLPSKSLIVNHQEVGVFNHEKAPQDSILLETKSDLDENIRKLYNMEPLENLITLDFCGKEVTFEEIEKTKQDPIICYQQE